MVHKYGMPSIANKKTTQLTSAVLFFSKKKSLSASENEAFGCGGPERYCRRLRLFGKLTGVTDAFNLHSSDADLIMDLLGKLYPDDDEDGVGNRNLAEKMDDDNPTLRLAGCLAAVEAEWQERGLVMPPEMRQELEAAAVEEMDQVRQKKVAMLDVDTLLEVVWLHWAKRREAAVSRLNELFVAHDTNKDGRLDIAEFKALIAALCAQEHVPEPSKKKTTKIYREAVEDTAEVEEKELPEDAISPAAFVAAVQRHGLLDLTMAKRQKTPSRSGRRIRRLSVDQGVVDVRGTAAALVADEEGR